MIRTCVTVKDERHYRLPALAWPIPARISVNITETLDSQKDCPHDQGFVNLTRFGDGTCRLCRANGWSPWWVAYRAMGEGTLAWVSAQNGLMMAMADIEANARTAVAA